MTLAELIEAARDLTPVERVLLADELLDSVESAEDTDPENNASRRTEVRRRIHDIETGRLRLVDGRETIRIARERVAERRSSLDA